MTRNMTAMNAAACAVMMTTPVTSDCAIPTIKASRLPCGHVVRRGQHPNATVPSVVRSILRSVRMRASTGNAVMDIATPMNSAKLVERHPGRGERLIQRQSQRRAEHEGHHDAGVRDRDGRTCLFPEPCGIQFQPDQEHVRGRPRSSKRRLIAAGT